VFCSRSFVIEQPDVSVLALLSGKPVRRPRIFRGVAIRIIADSSSADGQGSEIATLEGLGFNLKRMSDLSGGIMHNKFMIIDGKVLFTGSYNWSASAENYNFENALFLTGAATIQKYQAEFEKIWVR
jgi:phosphatidylserine/phosphatidylglycerophosphate/cardiolipin synthase-like enzyme